VSELAKVFRTRFSALVKHEPQPGVTYPEVLMVDAPLVARWRTVTLGIGGGMLGLITYFMAAPLVAWAVLTLFWSLSGTGGDLASYGDAAKNFALPAGMVATHLGLATLIPISMALVLFVHRFSPRWLHSVQPGFRWRYAFIATGAALVIFGGTWFLSQIGQPWVVRPEPAFWWYVIAIVLTSPLQAAAEEYFFRGYLLQAIHSTAPNSPWFGVVGSAAIFALLHNSGDVAAFLYAFAFGILAGWLVTRTGGLEAGIAIHVVNNLLTFGYAALSGTMVATYTNRVTSWVALVWALVGFGLFALAAIWLARRMNLATTTPGVRFGGPAEV